MMSCSSLKLYDRAIGFQKNAVHDTSAAQVAGGTLPGVNRQGGKHTAGHGSNS